MTEHPGKQKLDELVAGLPTHGRSSTMVTSDTIRSISDAYKAMEAENERLRELLAPFAYGDIDVSGTAIILGYPEASAAIGAARDHLLKGASRHEG